MAAGDEHLAGYRALGLRTLRIGSEAVVDPQAFDLAGRARKTVRKAVNRVERHGWTVEVVPAGELTAGLAAEVDAVERAWRARQPRLYGFAMAMDRLWGAQEDRDDVYVLARAPWGEVRAFQRYVPYRDGLSLDAMRRLDDEPNGISDALVVAALRRARELGCREVSLNFSSFAHLMAAETLERRSHRLARWALRRLHRRFQLERLVRFTEKFGPAWRPRHLVYTRQARLPLAALRVMQAEAYVKPPRARIRRNAWRPRPWPATRPSTPPGIAG
jgi:lysyl-tRNA synthetase class 2